MAAQKTHSLRVLGFPEDLEAEMTLAALKRFPGRKDARRLYVIEAIREKMEREAQEQKTTRGQS